jgi:hypothetical protein
MTAAERAHRYRQKNGPRINAVLRRRRQASAPVPMPDGRLHVRLTQLDGVLPNLASMKLSAWHKARGDEVHFSRSPYRSPTEPPYDRVERFRTAFRDAIVGGTWDTANTTTVEDIVGDFGGLDYSHWPDFTASLGFT